VASGRVHQFDGRAGGGDGAGFADRVGSKDGGEGVPRQLGPGEFSGLNFLDNIDHKKDKENPRPDKKGGRIGQSPVLIENQGTFIGAADGIQTQEKPGHQK